MPVFSFLNPAFLWALPAITIPVIIHLLSRRRLPEVQFPTTQFLRQLEPREIRRRRLRELLLLLLRTLAILLLVCAFARPSLTPRHAVTHSAAAVAMLLDDSESMAALDEQGRPRIEGAKARALAILDITRPGDELYLVTTTQGENAGSGRLADRVRAKRALARIEASALPAKMASAIQSARRALQRSALKARELYLISDLQRSNFTAEARGEIQAATASGARVYLVPLVQSRVANHAIEDVDPLLRPGPEGKGLELRSRFANHADAASDRIAIRVRRGDALVGGGDITLRADENRWAAMPVDWRVAHDSTTQSAPVLIEADQDALSMDDRWYTVLGAPRRLRVLRITEAREGSPAPRFASLALDPARNGTSGFSVEEGTPASLLTLSPSRADVVLLEDVASLPADAEARVRGFLREGGGLVVALGPHSDPGYYGSHLFPGIIDLALEGPEQAPEGSSFELKARLPSHDILEGLSVGIGSPLTQSRLRGLVRARQTSSRTDVVVQTTGGLPLVAAAPGVAVFLSSLADDWGDLPYSGSFVPLLRGLVAHAARAAKSAGAGSPRVGEAPAARLATAPATALLVRGPGGYTSQAAVQAEGTGYRAVADLATIRPGFYAFESGGKTLATVGVNVDPIESDLAPIAADSLESGVGAGKVSVLASMNALTTELRDTRRGRELWMSFLLVVGIALAGELALGSPGTQKS